MGDIGLNSVRMKNDEDVLTYTGRVEQLYYNLCNATLANKTPEEARILRQTLKDQALAIYINGLQMDLQTILRARNPETLELAMQMARQLEIEFSFNKELRNNENKTSQGGNKNNNGNRWSNNYQGNNPSGKNFGYKQNYNRGQNRQNLNNYNNVNRSNNFNSFGRNNNNSNNYPRNNNNGQYNNNRRQQNNPGCYICGRTNHVARDCRGNVAQIARRNTNNNAQPQNNNARQNTNNNFNNNSAPITCSYCDKIGHDSVSCYSKQRDERNNANRSGNGQVSNGNGVRSINQITAVTEELSLNDVSPSYHKLTGETIVNENEKINLKGINDKIVTTIGKITIILLLNNNKIKTEFHVVDKEFPIPRDGILGHHFLLQNNAIIDVANNILTINDNTPHELNKDKICYTLKPRTETIISIPIADPIMENKNILIQKQELIQDVYCANIINTVKNGNTVISWMVFESASTLCSHSEKTHKLNHLTYGC
ncbi:hypothetical protein AGLY_015182 [Aphis glycines]|uniref:CCHC-type domain-containing protein n=1 Tax=Aphis glycines TaxID=307491 RepID=A0A6G0T3G3_APHGL|nr:hypothetical protein AGLY_015182 [Aphis glycines]